MKITEGRVRRAASERLLLSDDRYDEPVTEVIKL